MTSPDQIARDFEGAITPSHPSEEVMSQDERGSGFGWALMFCAAILILACGCFWLLWEAIQFLLWLFEKTETAQALIIHKDCRPVGPSC